MRLLPMYWQISNIGIYFVPGHISPYTYKMLHGCLTEVKQEDTHTDIQYNIDKWSSPGSATEWMRR